VGLDLIPRALNPAITVLTVTREWGMTRPEALEYARTHGLPVPAADRPYHIGANLWGRSIKSRGLENPWMDPPEDLYTLTRAPEECPAEAAYVDVTLERGVPTAINGVVMPLVELIASLGTIAGAHGVGRGIFYEAPAAVVLHTAHRELQRMVTAREAERFSRVVSGQYTDVVCNGLWFTPLHEALDAYVEKIQERVTGVVRLKLFKGDCRVAARKSPFAMSQLALPSDGADAVLDQGPAVDVLKIVGLSSKAAARKLTADGPQSPLPTADWRLPSADCRLPTDD
jgi:argininosuccinate synthase